MSRIRLEINWRELHAFLTNDETSEEVTRITRAVDANATANGSQSRWDFAVGAERARGAVIAGYEDGATAENTRDVLLRSLDVGE